MRGKTVALEWGIIIKTLRKIILTINDVIFIIIILSTTLLFFEG